MKNQPLLLLVNLGTPEAPTPAAVRTYLKEFLSDPRVVSLPRWLWLPLLHGVILPFRSSRSARAYASIWMDDQSPLMLYSQRLTEKLQQRLAGKARVQLAMRYGQPSMADVLDAHARDDVFVLPLYPQFSSTTTASVMDAYAQWSKKKKNLPSLYFLRDYHQHPRYVQALADSIRQAWTQHRGQKLLFSFHGIPQRLVKAGDPYEQQCLQTAQQVADALQLEPEAWQVMFQSRFGKETWLQPYASETLQQLPAEGVRDVDVICPGFSVDCLETLEEMAVENRAVFLQAGGTHYQYIPCLNDQDAQVELMASLFEEQHAQA